MYNSGLLNQKCPSIKALLTLKMSLWHVFLQQAVFLSC